MLCRSFLPPKNKAITAATPIAMPAFLPTVRTAKSLQRRTFYDGASAKILLVAKEVDGNSPMQVLLKLLERPMHYCL